MYFWCIVRHKEKIWAEAFKEHAMQWSPCGGPETMRHSPPLLLPRVHFYSLNDSCTVYCVSLIISLIVIILLKLFKLWDRSLGLSLKFFPFSTHFLAEIHCPRALDNHNSLALSSFSVVLNQSWEPFSYNWTRERPPILVRTCKVLKPTLPDNLQKRATQC